MKKKMPQYVQVLIFPIIELLLKKSFLVVFKKEKKLILNHLSRLISCGIEISYSINQLINESIKNRKYVRLYFLNKIKEQLKYGISLYEALYSTKLINQKEFEILKNSSNISDSILLITNDEKMTIPLTKLFALFIFPSFLLIFILFLIKGTIYLYLFCIPLILIVIMIALYKLIEKTKNKMLFKLFLHIEKKFMFEILNDIELLYDKNIPLPRIIDVLLEEEKNHIKKSIYTELNTQLLNGNYNLTKVLSKYHINNMTLHMINISEETGNREPLKAHISSLKLDFKSSIKNLKKLFFYVGIILAIIISVKPFLDIL